MKKKSQLVGRFFHTWEDGKISHQGEVLSEEAPGLFLVGYFEWAFGTESNQELKTIEDMKTWTFYKDAETMIFYWEAWDRQNNRRHEHGR